MSRYATQRDSNHHAEMKDQDNNINKKGDSHIQDTNYICRKQDESYSTNRKRRIRNTKLRTHIKELGLRNRNATQKLELYRQNSSQNIDGVSNI